MIRGYRSPASLRSTSKASGPIKGGLQAKVQSRNSSTTEHFDDHDDVLEKEIKNPSPSQNEASYSSSAKASNLYHQGNSAGASSSESSASTSPRGTQVIAPWPGSVTQGNGKNTKDESSGGNSGRQTPPAIQGKVKPLKGLIAHSGVSIFNEAWATTCSDPRILLLDLTNMSILLDNPLDESVLQGDATFNFDPLALKLNISQPNRYMLQTVGCSINYQRIISSFYEPQDLDQATTLISKTINSRIAGSLGSVNSFNLHNLYLVVQKEMDEGESFEDVYLKLDTNLSLKQTFQDTFLGGSTLELKEAAPDINSITVHKNLKEKLPLAFEVSPFHWDSEYSTAIEWQLDGVVKATISNWSYTPDANSPPTAVVTLVVGYKNTSDDLVDRSRPYHEIDFDVSIADLHPASAPAFYLATTSSSPSATRTVDLEVDTGASFTGGFANCETFSEFAITEGAAMPASGDFNYSCSAGPLQPLSYTLTSPGDGTKAVKIWARDVAGRISPVPTILNVVLDTTAPVIQFTGIQSAYVADRDATFSWTLTEPHSSHGQNFEIFLFDGASWITLPSLALTDGPHENTSFNTTVTLPNINVSGARLRIRYQDTLGNLTVAESEDFDIQRPQLGSAPVNLDFNSIYNKSESAPLALSFTNSGMVDSKVCSAVTITGTHASEFEIVSDGCNGNVIAASGSCPVSVKAKPENKGTRSATITLACDGDSYSTTLTVTSLNNAPEHADFSFTVAEDGSRLVTFGADADTDGDSLTYSIVSAPGHGILSGCASTSGNYSCTYVPSADYNGPDTFTFKSNDGSVDSDVITVSVTVNAVNDAPTIAPTQSVTTAEDTAVSFNLNAGNDVDGNPLTYHVVSPPSTGTLSCTEGTSTSCTYTPADDFAGSTTFTYKVNDGTVDSPVATVTINVTNTNDPPVVGEDQTIAAVEDTAVNFTLNTATDIDLPAQTLSYKLISAPTKGTLSGCINTSTYETSRNCTYTPHADVNGTDTFTYRAYDSLTDSLTIATVTINITAQNDAPTLAAAQSVTTPEDTPITFNLSLGADTEEDPLTYIRVSSTTSGSISCTGGTDRSCTYTPYANFNGTDSFTYKVNDGNADSTAATVTITVTPVNDPPVMAADQSFSVNDATNLVINLSPASDIDGGSLSYKIVTPPAHGTLSDCITTGGYGTDLSCNYISNANYHGTDSFTFIAHDTYTDAITYATVTINVTDTTPAPAPQIILASSVYTNSTATSFTATNCADTPYLFINEGSAPASGTSGWQACTLTAGALTYSMGTTQGAHTVKVWSKDAYGNVSASSTDFTIYYDTVLPALSLALPPTLRGGQTYNLAWTATESYSSSGLNFTVEAFDGTSWSTVGTTASVEGALSSTPFSRSWTVPYVNTTSALFRVSFTDRAGNSNTVTSSSFAIDSTAPNLSITSPAANSYHLTSATITGSCEIGRPVEFSGDIQTPFSISCTSGTYSQLVNFSNGDGNKNIIVSQTDAVGNTTSLSRNLIRDEVAPVLTRTTGESPFFTRNDVPNTWGGTCEGNYIISVSGAETTSFACSGGTWSWTPSPKISDGIFNYNLVQTDGAGNTSSPPLTLSWERDATPPSFSMISPFVVSSGTTRNYTSNQSSFSLSGNCEGINPIHISGSVSDVISCSSGSWSWTIPTVATDGPRSYVFTQADSAGNTSAITLNWTRDTNGPTLSLANNTIKNNINTATFNGNCQAGVDVIVSGTESVAIPCPAGTWSFTTTAQVIDGTFSYTFTQTFSTAPYNSTSFEGTWIRETDRPTISSFTTNAPYPSKNSYVPVFITATSQNPSVFLSHFCIKYSDAATPPADSPCFMAVNSPTVGLNLSQALNVSNYKHLITWTPGIYTVYLWVKDEAGNISLLTNGGSGTTNVDKFTHAYDPGIPPSVWNVAASNDPNAPLPPTRTQTEVPAGSDVYIRWSASDNYPLPAGAISLYYTPDEINFTQIVSGLDNGDHGCGIPLGPNEGCYLWAGGSPLNTAYKIRVRVTDSTDISNQLISNPLNTGLIKILAGNTESGLNGSARTAMFYTYRQFHDVGTLVVDKDGRFYFADYKRGIITIDQNDGKQKIFIPVTGTTSGDGGPAVNATMTLVSKIALDYQNRLLIIDYNRIRRVDLNASTPTIETIIGGGSDTSDTVNDPRQLYMDPFHYYDIWDMSGVFMALPNGDIWFHSDHPFKEWNAAPYYRIRYYQAATGKILSKYISGIGDAGNPGVDIMKCALANPGISFDPSTSAITEVTLQTLHRRVQPGCDGYSEGWFRVKVDPVTFQAVPTTNNSWAYYHHQWYTGMDGKFYPSYFRYGVGRVKPDGGIEYVVGTGTLGECPDGTLATACNVDIQNFFVTATGKMYFTDRGLIRTIDDEGKVFTLFGQRLTYGNNVNALNARIGSITRAYRLDNGKIIFNDTAGTYIKEFTIEGNVNIVAGNGSSVNLNPAISASAQGMKDASNIAVDRATGNVYAGYAEGTYGNYARLNRSTGLWEHIIGNLSDGGTHFTVADGLPGLDVNGGVNEYNRGLPMAFDNNQFLIHRMRHNYAELRWGDFMIKSYDATDSFRQTHLAGIEGFHSGYQGERGNCANTTGVLAENCEIGYWDTYQHAQWDPVLGRWIFAQILGHAENEIYELYPGGNIRKLATTPQPFHDSFYLKWESGKEMLYYCNGTRILKYNLSDQVDLGALPWSMPNLTCKGITIDYNPTNNSLIFPFEQNGLYGVAEYYLP